MNDCLKCNNTQDPSTDSDTTRLFFSPTHILHGFLARLFKARHARRELGIRLTLLHTERLVWYGGARAAKLESAQAAEADSL